MATDRIPEHWQAWLGAHPKRSLEWLREKAREGFDVHHIDGNSENNDPENLVLIEHGDHMRLHGAPNCLRVPELRVMGGPWGKPGPKGKRKPKKAKGSEYTKGSKRRAVYDYEVDRDAIAAYAREYRKA